MRHSTQRSPALWVRWGILWAAASACWDGRPEATGEVGQLKVYGQLDAPVWVPPGGAVLPRPQRLAFRFHAPGTGPRDIRVEVHQHGKVRVVHEERRGAQPEPVYLDYLLVLKDRAPDDFDLVTVVEAPHDQPIRTRYRIELRGDRSPPEARKPIGVFERPKKPSTGAEEADSD